MSGADRSDGMLAQTWERLSWLPASQHRVVHAETMTLPCSDGESNVVVAAGVLDCFGDVDRAASEVRRVVPSGGALLMSVRNKYRTYFIGILRLQCRLAVVDASHIALNAINRPR